jgi:hypothetical protein
MQQKGLDKDRNVAFRALIGRIESLEIFRIGELSARFCTNLIVRGIPESAVPPPPSQRSEIAARQAEPRSAARKVHKTRSELHRKGVVFGAIEAGLTGAKYCSAMDERKVRVPDRWKEDGCPSTYTEAYKLPKWRNRIHNEKHRIRKQYDEAPQAERKAVIEGTARTRRARH